MQRKPTNVHTGHCPTCDKTFIYTHNDEAPNRPFCSRRCREIDLGKWLNEEYRVSDPIRPTDDHLADSDGIEE